MEKSYSIAEARNNLAAIVHAVEEASAVGPAPPRQPVAVLLSVEEYRRLLRGGKDFWSAYDEFRNDVDLGRLDIEPEVFEDVRDPSPGREVGWRT